MCIAKSQSHLPKLGIKTILISQSGNHYTNQTVFIPTKH